MARKTAKPKKTKMTTATKRVVKNTQTASISSFNQLVLATVVFWLGNSVLLLLANELFPGLIVLGTHLISPLMAAVYAGGVISLVGVSATPIIESVAMKRHIRLTEMHWMTLYFLLNTAIIWLVSRFSELVGMGISVWWVALVMGLVFDVIQGMLMKYVVSGSES
jgi:hypothetical protein